MMLMLMKENTLKGMILGMMMNHIVKVFQYQDKLHSSLNNFVNR